MKRRQPQRVQTNRRISIVKQDELVECGLACFVMIANYYGHDINLADVRQIVPSLARGASLATLSTLANHYDFEGVGYQLETSDLAQMSTPLVLHWDNEHFVVLGSLRNGRARIYDPQGFSKWMTLKQVDSHFSGVAFAMRPKADSIPLLTSRRHGPSYLWSHAKLAKSKVIASIALTFVLQISALATPLFAQIAIDRALPGKSRELLWLVAIAFIVFIVLNSILSYLKQNLIRKIGAAFGASIASHVTHHLFRLPLEWFRKREPGGVLSKIQMVLPVKHVLSEDLPSIFVNAILAVFTFLMMVFYSPALSIIGLGAVATYGAVRALILPRQQSALSEMIAEIGKEQALLISSLQCMRSIRLACREDDQHGAWNEAFSKFIWAETRYKKWTDRHSTLQTALLAIANVIALSVAVDFAMRGAFSLGMIFSFIAYLSLFLTAGVGVIDKYSNLRELESYLIGLEDIIGPGHDPAFGSQAMRDKNLKGQIELKDVTFRYGVDGDDILRGVNLRVEAGESVAITGPSGGGKSTLAQILLGLHRPTSGSIFIDGEPLDEFGYRNYYSQIAAVLQDEGLFSGTILDNITMRSNAIDIEFVRTCAQAAAISDEIDAWPMGYRTQVGDAGIALSSGQRQRVLIARALYCRPRILVLDEATANLDSRREKQVSSAIRELGITRITFAHRRETAIGADRILVLDAGKITSATKASVESLFA